MTVVEANSILAAVLFFAFLDGLRDGLREMISYFCCRRASIEKCEKCRDWRCPRWHTEFIEQMKQEALNREKNS